MFNFVKNWIVGSLKKVIIYEIEAEGDKLQAELKARIAKEGPGAIDRTIDAAQRRTISAIQTRGPVWGFLVPLREKAAEAVEHFGDDIQEKIKARVADLGPAAVDLAFDGAQARLIAAVNALKM